MADIGYTEYVYEEGLYEDETPQAGPQATQKSGSVSKFVSIAGAVASIALVAGVGVWSYKLMVRDVSGVPVVRAAEGPMRVQPENPGGRQADHQGLAVNAVAAQGTAAATADRLVLAPRPVDLAETDGPVQDALPGPAVPAHTQATAPNEAVDETVPVGSEDALAAFQNGSVAALVDQLTQGVTPLSETEELALEDVTDSGQPETLIDESQAVADAAPALYVGPGLARSLRPLARPATLVIASTNNDAMAEALSNAVDTSASLDVDPDSLPVGTRLAQLGAYDSAEVAKEEWDRIYARFEDYMQGKQRVVQKASSGGRTFYRLRAMGFDDLSDARRFCSALVAESADCIPVTTR